MVAQECTPTSRPQRDRPCSALCPHYFRSLSAISATFPRVLLPRSSPHCFRSLSAVLRDRPCSALCPQCVRNVSAVFPLYFRNISAVLPPRSSPHCFRSLSAVFPHRSCSLSALFPQFYTLRNEVGRTHLQVAGAHQILSTPGSVFIVCVHSTPLGVLCTPA